MLVIDRFHHVVRVITKVKLVLNWLHFNFCFNLSFFIVTLYIFNMPKSKRDKKSMYYIFPFIMFLEMLKNSIF